MPVCTNDQEIVFPGPDPRQRMTIEKLMTCDRPLAAAASDEAVRSESIAMLKRYNIWAVTSGSLAEVTAWRAAEPKRIIPAIGFATGESKFAPADFRKLFQEKKFAIFAEVTAQYRGHRLDDPSYEPFFALAEELDIPVGVHLGEGPPGGPHVFGSPTYRAALTSPLQLEEVLVRHPKLRLYVMHFGSPLVDEMIALLYSHPQVYVMWRKTTGAFRARISTAN